VTTSSITILSRACLLFPRIVVLWQVAYDRQVVRGWTQDAIENPDEYGKCEMDGMDQKKTEVPHVPKVPKCCQDAYLMKLHLVCCKFQGDMMYSYWTMMNLEAGSNRVS
jgi:hypothetical protein